HLRAEFYEHPQNRVMGHGRELYGKRKDNSDVPVEVSLSFYRGDAQLYVIAFIVDITHRKEIERNILSQQKELEKMASDMRKLNAHLEAKVEERTLILKEALQKLEESQMELSEALDKEKQLNDLKSRFVSMASHEFRTPLSTILSSATLIEKYMKEDEQDKRERHISRIKDNVKNLTDILEDFLSLGKLEEGLIKANFSELDVKEFVDNILRDLNELKKDAQRILYTHDGSEKFSGDKFLLKNILINLISNAIKFSVDDGIIEVKTSSDKSKLTIQVKDSG